MAADTWGDRSVHLKNEAGAEIVRVGVWMYWICLLLQDLSQRACVRIPQQEVRNEELVHPRRAEVGIECPNTGEQELKIVAEQA
jgi:hypothetical protein